MKKNIYVSIIGIFLFLMLLSGVMIYRYYRDTAKQNEVYEELVDIVEAGSEIEDTEISDETSALKEYAELYEQNEDMVGWIRIDDTKINYPVMQSVNEPNFYLKHSFDKTYSDYGCPYVQENCNVITPSDNVVIYGHNMKNGSMFSALTKYKEKAFWEKHKTITFDTLVEHYEYEIIAAFKTVVYTDSPKSFKYYQFVQADTKEDFNAYVEKCKELSFYDTGVSAEYGDKLITLSTCEYSQKNGRMVVVAKRVQ